jgi:putative flippase GtrA
MVPSLIKKIARYATVGILTLSIYILVAKASGLFGLSLPWQVSLAFISAVVFNYLLQRSWVFADSRPVIASLPKYVAMVCVGYVVNLLAIDAMAPRISMTMALVVASALVAMSNALFSFTWVFLNGDARGVAPAKTGLPVPGPDGYHAARSRSSTPWPTPGA